MLAGQTAMCWEYKIHTGFHRVSGEKNCKKKLMNTFYIDYILKSFWVI